MYIYDPLIVLENVFHVYGSASQLILFLPLKEQEIVYIYFLFYSKLKATIEKKI